VRIIIPMAGNGLRLRCQFGPEPKPLIPVAGKPMVEWALSSLAALEPELLVCVILQEHDDEFGIEHLIRQAWQGSPVEVLALPQPTGGQLCTVMAASQHLTASDVLIAPVDTIVRSQLARDLDAARRMRLDGLVSVADLLGDQWSFVRTDERGLVTAVAEKQRVGPWASTGLYWFASGSDFAAHAARTLADEVPDLGEHYVIPVYRRYLETGGAIGVSIAEDVIEMGNPDALTAAAERLQGARA
jgi:dTDP-glucose pyrophosphorylase